MSDAMDRFKERKDERQHELDTFNIHGVDVNVTGDTSDDLSKYMPLAAGALTEITASQLKKKEEAQKAAAYKNSEAGKAEAAAAEARKKAAMLRAESISDPSKKAAADQAELDAQAAETKAAFFRQGATQAQSQANAITPSGHGHDAGMSTGMKVAIGVGAVGVLGTIVYLATRKR